MTLALSRRLGRPWWMTTFGREPFGDVFFDRLWPEWTGETGEKLAPSLDFSEKDGNYILTAELPGMNREDISINIEDGYVTVSGKKEEKIEEKEPNYYLKETRTGSFSRSIKLPGKVMEDKVEAVYKDGVLTVTMPHEEETKVKKIEIH
ncbi:Small heat shock protein C2 [uncultured Desulfobacterium sp.]|uniref:Small heat shock protein C2 n=1 Tax=uncultured Desulfobacterium sp. TaxID=201089 RepID=A0A445N2J7_9BACT|nr:Small heat shock protein C2 [uncultured Desulfobacterium sp.]